MADGATPNNNFILPEVGASKDSWGTKLNDNWTSVDALLNPGGTGGFLPIVSGEVAVPFIVNNNAGSLYLKNSAGSLNDKVLKISRSSGDVVFSAMNDNLTTKEELARLKADGLFQNSKTIITGGIGDARYFQNKNTVMEVGTVSTASTTDNGVIVRSNQSGGITGEIHLQSQAAVSDATAILHQYYGSTRTAFMRANGNWLNQNGTYAAISDERLKENVAPASSQLDDIMAMDVVNFNFIGQNLKQIGFIAQALEQVKPGLVDTEDDDMGTKSVKTSVLIPILVKALQELVTRVEGLEAEIQDLK